MFVWSRLGVVASQGLRLAPRFGLVQACFKRPLLSSKTVRPIVTPFAPQVRGFSLSHFSLNRGLSEGELPSKLIFTSDRDATIKKVGMFAISQAALSYGVSIAITAFGHESIPLAHKLVLGCTLSVVSTLTAAAINYYARRYIVKLNLEDSQKEKTIGNYYDTLVIQSCDMLGRPLTSKYPLVDVEPPLYYGGKHNRKETILPLKIRDGPIYLLEYSQNIVDEIEVRKLVNLPSPQDNKDNK